MPGSSSNLIELRYINEAVFGVTPATPALKLLRLTGESLNAGLQTAISEEIRSDRNVQDLVQVGSDAGGSVEFELSHGSFDDLFCGALGQDDLVWSADGAGFESIVNQAGSALSFTVQKNLKDLVNQFFNFTGMRVNTMSLAIGPNKIVTGSFGFMGKEGARAGAQFAGATFPAGSSSTPMNGAAGVSLNQIDAAAITGGLMNFTLNTNNNYRAQDAVGSLGAVGIVPGRFEVTGDLEVYFADGGLYDKFQNMTPFSVVITMLQATEEMKVTVPAAKFETAEVVAQGTDTDIMLKASYRGLYDAGIGGSVKLTRTT